MRLVFWLLDINPKIDDEKTELWLWGIDKKGNRALIIERNFKAYFYAVIHGSADPNFIANEIKTNLGKSIIETEIVNRRFFGKPVIAIKVTCQNASEISKIAEEVRKLDGVTDCLEDDIRVAMRYLIDNDVAPGSWYESEVNEEENLQGARVTKVYSNKTQLKILENSIEPTLRLMAFSMFAYCQEGQPNSAQDPIMVLSTVTSSGEERQFTVDSKLNDKKLLKDFNEYTKEFDPDIIVSYGSNDGYWSYLKNRSRRHKLKLDFDRSGSEPHTGIYGHVTLTGIVNLDLIDFLKMFPEVKQKTLVNFAKHLDININDSEVIEEVHFAKYWDDPKKQPQLQYFSSNNARVEFDMAKLLLDFTIQMSSLTSLPLDHVMTAATGFRVDWYLIKLAKKIGELVPHRLDQQYASYTGGLVLSPKPGLHDNIAILDFKSMYPNIMITYNLSPDTYIEPDQPDPEVGSYKAPEVGYRFRKSPPGFYKEALTNLINARSIVRQKIKTIGRQSVEYQILDARQKAIKILTNAIYGYAGWVGARWYIKPVAEAAAAWGRSIILTASKMADDKGITVIYGDTDSLFIDYEKDKVNQLKEDIKADLKLDVEVSEVYKRVFFTEAKKRYAGLRQDGTIDVIGLEVIRGDWAEIAKEVQQHILEIILKEQSPKNAITYLHSVVSELKQRKVPFSNLIIWKTLTKPPNQYAVKTPHVEAAKKLIENGWRLTTGDKVGYVVLTGKGPLHSRVKPYVFANIEEVDIDYYITNQVLPAAVRILAFFNITEKDLMKTMKEEKTKSLTDFF